MTSIFAEFAHTENGDLCTDVDGLVHLSTTQECRDAVSYAKSFNSNARYEGDLYSSSYPEGCIMHGSGNMWLNRPPFPTGEGHSRYKNICRKGNT